MLDTEPLYKPAARRRVDGLPGPAPSRSLPVSSAERISPSMCCAGCAPGYPGDEHRQLRLAVAGVWQPDARGRVRGLDRGVWFFNHLVFEEKMMTIFSMLFGAGLVLMDQRAEARGAQYRRGLLSTGSCGCSRSAWFILT